MSVLDTIDTAREQAERQQGGADVLDRGQNDGDQERNVTDAREGESESAPPAAEVLVQLAKDVELIHTPERESFALVNVNGHRETWALRSRDFRTWLARQFYERRGKPPPAQAMQDAFGVLEGKALYDGDERRVHVRIAGDDERVVIDLGTEDWSAVEVTADGWRVVQDPGVVFRRPAGLLPLPVPESGGSIGELREFLNVDGKDEQDNPNPDDFILIVAALVAALRPRGPYPVLAVYGEQGSSKSTVARLMRRLVDPNESEIRGAPRQEHDLVIAARNGWVLAFDNLSRLPDYLADALCRISTGGGFSTRRLYTDDEEELFNAQRPIVLNGISELSARGDLLDRSLIVTLPRIPPEARLPERKFWERFTPAAGRILGSLLEAVACGLRELPGIELDEAPRMADFAEWIVACSGGLPFTDDDFLRVYTENRRGALEASLGGDPVAEAIMGMDSFDGTATELLKALEAKVAEKVVASKDWPRSASALSGRARRIAPALREAGIKVEFHREPGGKRERKVRIDHTDQKEGESDRPDRPGRPKANGGGAIQRDGRGDGRDAEDSDRPACRPGESPITTGKRDGGDGGDGVSPTRSGSDADSADEAADEVLL